MLALRMDCFVTITIFMWLICWEYLIFFSDEKKIRRTDYWRFRSFVSAVVVVIKKINGVHSDTIPMVHVKSHVTYKLDVLHELQRLDDVQLVLHEPKAPNDEQPLAMDGTHTGLNGMMWCELHAFLSPNFPHLWLIVFQRHQHNWPPQRMQATLDYTVWCAKMKKKSKKQCNQIFNLNTFIRWKLSTYN